MVSKFILFFSALTFASPTYGSTNSPFADWMDRVVYEGEFPATKQACNQLSKKQDFSKCGKMVGGMTFNEIRDGAKVLGTVTRGFCGDILRASSDSNTTMTLAEFCNHIFAHSKGAKLKIIRTGTGE